MKLPNSIQQHRDKWFWLPQWKRMHCRSQQTNGVFVGRPGSGKSFSAIYAAWLLDRTGLEDKSRFTADRIVFNATDFFALATQKLPIGSAIVLDDAGLAAYAPDTMRKEVREICKCFQSMRSQRRAVFLTLPSLNMLTGNVQRTLLNYFEMRGIDYDKGETSVQPQYMQLAPKSGRLYFHNYLYKTWATHPITNVRIPRRVQRPPLRIPKPEEKLIKAYEKKKVEALKIAYEESQRLVKGEPKEKKPSFAEDLALARNKLKQIVANGRVDQTELLLLGMSEYRARLVAGKLNKELRVGKQLA